jgi:MFS family permease
VLGAANALLVDAASFGLAALVIAVKVRVGHAVPSGVDREPYLPALRAGFAYVRGDRLVLGTVLVCLATNLLDQAHVGVFMPVWAHDVLGSPQALGLVFGAFGLGAVLGNLLFTALASRLPRLTTFRICFLLGGAPHFFVLAATDSVTAVAITLFASGVVCAAINPILAAAAYERIPRHLQARVFGLLRATAWAGIPLGSLLGGFAVEGVGLTAALVLSGAVYLAVTVVPLATSTWQELDAPATGPSPRRARPRAVPVGPVTS